MFNTIPAKDFIQDFKDYPAYDNVRKIASIVDGLKNSSRKVIYYCLKNNISKPVKTSQFKSQIENATEYLHGDITGVVETLAKDYVGACNINLLEPHGNFGTRLVKTPSAPRYTFTKPSPELYELFDKDDLNILDRQYFEGNEIEPVYLMPSLPLILINGSEGISTGFAQKIFCRDPKKIKASIIKKLNGVKHTYKEGPWYRGFGGEIVQGTETNKWIIKGVVEVVNTTTVEIKEIPFTYDLQQYVKVLDKLENSGVIRSYQDKSEDSFNFIVKFSRSELAKYSEAELLKVLKLEKAVSENYTVQNEENSVMVMDSVDEIMNYFINVRLDFLQDRIEYKIDLLDKELLTLTERKRFIGDVISNKLVLAKRKKVDIESDLSKADYQQVDGSYDYLLNMNFMSLTEERMNSLTKQISEKNKVLDYYKNATPTTLYLDELKGK